MIKAAAQLARFQEEDSLQNAALKASIKLQKANKQPGWEENAPAFLSLEAKLGILEEKEGDYLPKTGTSENVMRARVLKCEEKRVLHPGLTLQAAYTPGTLSAKPFPKGKPKRKQLSFTFLLISVVVISVSKAIFA